MDDKNSEQSNGSLPRGKVLCITSAKGGSGKTLLVVSAASLLAEIGCSVLLIDTDFSTRGLSLYVLKLLAQAPHSEIASENCLAEVLLEDLDPNRVAPLVLHQDTGVFEIILPNRNFRLGGAPEDSFLRLGAATATGLIRESTESSGDSWKVGPVDFETRYFRLLRSICDRFRHSYDYIIIDTRGGYDYSSKVPAVLADAYCIVIEADANSVQQVAGLQTNILAFSKKLGIATNFAGFIVNKTLAERTDAATFGKAVTDLYGGETFGLIPADRAAIYAYQKRGIPYQLYPGSDISYYGVSAIKALFSSCRPFTEAETVSLEGIRKFVRRSWLVKQGILLLDRWYPTAVLGLVALILTLLLAYLRGISWASSGRLFYVATFLMATAIVMPFARFFDSLKDQGTKEWKRWITPLLLSTSCGLILVALTPAIRKSASGNVFLEQAKLFQQQLYSTQLELDSVRSAYSTSKDQSALTSLEVENLKAQVSDLQKSLSAAQSRAFTAEANAAKLQYALNAAQSSTALKSNSNSPASSITTSPIPPSGWNDGPPTQAWCYQEPWSKATAPKGFFSGYGAYCHYSEQTCQRARSSVATDCVLLNNLSPSVWGQRPSQGGISDSWFRINMDRPLGPPFPQPALSAPAK